MNNDKKEDLDEIDDSKGDTSPTIAENAEQSVFDEQKPGWFRKGCTVFVAIMIGIKGFRVFDFQMGELTFAFSLGCFCVMAYPSDVVRQLARFWGKRK